jgi:hypothetical protein
MAINFASAAQKSQLSDNIDAVQNVPGATLCGWVNLTSKIVNATLIRLSYGSGRTQSRCTLYACGTAGTYLRGTGRALDSDAAADFNSAVLSLTTGVWSFIAGTWDYVNRRITLYLNTSSDQSPLLTSWTSGNCSNTNSVANTLGNQDSSVGNFPLSGMAEDLRIYNRILSAGELQTILACRGCDKIILGLRARYLFNSLPSGTVCAGGEITYDEKGAYNGTYTAGCTYTGSQLKQRAHYQ